MCIKKVKILVFVSHDDEHKNVDNHYVRERLPSQKYKQI